ncbi:MAG: hypothetical protein HN500_02235, partial [Nitrosopumilus sp.]|nr:hypothetical protein [Nitrosopumilus sp.]
MKLIVTITIVIVVMIGVMAPSVFAQSDHPNLIVSTEHVNDSIVNKFDMQ